MSNPNLSEQDRSAIIDALLAGRKIQAIKLYREASGLGLKEAKEFIDSLMQELSKEHPDIFQINQGKGCLGVVLVVILGVISIWMHA